jgi:nucleoid-associated protein YgaU
MKNMVLLVMLVLIALLVYSCESTESATTSGSDTSSQSQQSQSQQSQQSQSQQSQSQQTQSQQTQSQQSQSQQSQQPQSQQSQSQPQTSAQSQTQSQSQSAEGNRHRSNIILDGAVKYTVRSGDVLTGIARRFYQDGSYYPLIMMVSDDVVQDPDKIEPGMILTVPDLRRNLADARAKSSINAYFARIADIEDQRGRHNTAALIRNHAR